MKKSWKRFCKDDISKIENYELAKNDNFNGWCIHHRLEFDVNENEVQHPIDLIRLDMYYHRPYFELIFMKISDHIRLHHVGKKHGLGHKVSEELRMKISLGNKGKKLSQTTKDKISKSGKGRHWKLSDETRKKMSEAHKGKKRGHYNFK